MPKPGAGVPVDRVVCRGQTVAGCALYVWNGRPQRGPSSRCPAGASARTAVRSNREDFRLSPLVGPMVRWVAPTGLPWV